MTEDNYETTEQAVDEKPAKKTEVVSVRIAGSLDGQAIVQWLDGDKIRRSLVKNADVRLGDEAGTGLVEATKLKKRYGDDLGALIDGLPDAERIEARLNQVGIWTCEDVVRHKNEALGAFRSAFNDAFNEFVRKAKEQNDE